MERREGIPGIAIAAVIRCEPKSMLTFVLQLSLVVALLMSSNLSRAENPYDDYVADLLLHESHQARNPQEVIRYSDGQNGRLLKSTLNPQQAAIMLEMYFQQPGSARLSQLNLVQVLSPLLGRYERAFSHESKLYEAEYLDCLEILAFINTRPSYAQQHAPSGKDKRDATLTEEQKKTNAALQKLAATVSTFSSNMNRQLALTIRRKVEANMFSPDGAQRALHIARLLDPIEPPPSTSSISE